MTNFEEIKRSAASYLGPYMECTAGDVMFCKKHLHELCPEFEVKNER